MKNILYIDQLCTRCGSKKFISKIWKEKMPTYGGSFTEVEYSQIECTNVNCQEEFVQQQADDAKKKEALRVKKEANDAARKASSLAQAKKARTNTSTSRF